MNRLLQFLRRCLRPIVPRRYRVTPRHNPFVLRRELRRDIRRMLRQASGVPTDTRR